MKTSPSNSFRQRSCVFLVFASLCFSSLCLPASSAPFYVDISHTVNTAPEDDGIAANGKGGWTDEGINDMFVYPPLPSGEIERNAHFFRIIDPKKNNGLSVLMLRGESVGKDKPESVTVKVPDVRGKYIYFLQQSVGRSSAPAGYEAAVYTVEYKDGSKENISIVNGKHLLHWWCSQWWENRERDAWPINIGRNVYTMKWKQLIGIWATQWQNPHPELPISAITFRSAGKANPVIWAVTIDDADYHASEESKKGSAWGRPADPPENYFEPKLALERKAVYEEALANGFIEGIRSVEVIAPDMLAVTVDPALTKLASGPCLSGDAAASTYQKPESFKISSAGDKNYSGGKEPVKVGRDSYEYWNGNIGPFPMCTTYWHTFYLRLPSPLISGNTYKVSVAGIDPSLRREMELSYDDAKTETKVVKVNQVAYAAGAGQRYAYLGWWAGDLGSVDLSSLKKFEVINEKDASIALSGELRRREASHDASGEQLWDMDISRLPRGRYHIRIPGLGISSSFDVGGEGIKRLFLNTQRAFYHQRCGFPLEEPYTKFKKPACHLWVYESGHMADDPNYTPKPGEKKCEFRGGYHDAADFDCFTYHLRATAQNLDVYERFPSLFSDKQLNIAESGNGIPDLLDEALWALFFYLEHQADDGAVPKGRCNDQDSRNQDHAKWGPFGIFHADAKSNLEYAAVAAQFSIPYRKYNPDLAGQYLKSAIKAFDWAQKNPPEKKDESINAFTFWAASVLFRATGDKRFNDAALAATSQGKLRMHWKDGVLGPMFMWQYIICDRPGTDAEIQKNFRQEIIKSADYQLKNRIDAESYRWGGDSKRALGWGNGNGGGHYADLLLRAYWLTGERKYLDAASLNADFQLGCNPLSKTFISGMGARPPNHPQISAFLYEAPGKRGRTVEGITIYGISSGNPANWHPAERPVLRRWRDLGNGGAEVSSEFTITETIGFSAMLYAALFAEDK